jgi:hypothetical protein
MSLLDMAGLRSDGARYPLVAAGPGKVHWLVRLDKSAHYSVLLLNLS